MIAYRTCDRRLPFLWESSSQPAARWHGDGEGPVHYLADTPAGAWAEFLRHEDITDAGDLEGVSRALWAVEIGQPVLAQPALSRGQLLGGVATHHDCRAEATRLRATAADGLRAPSAALLPGEAAGWRVDGGLVRQAQSDGEVVVLFGSRPDLVGWCVVDAGRPPAALVASVRPPQ